MKSQSILRKVGKRASMSAFFFAAAMALAFTSPDYAGAQTICNTSNCSGNADNGAGGSGGGGGGGGNGGSGRDGNGSAGYGGAGGLAGGSGTAGTGGAAGSSGPGVSSGGAVSGTQIGLNGSPSGTHLGGNGGTAGQAGDPANPNPNNAADKTTNIAGIDSVTGADLGDITFSSGVGGVGGGGGQGGQGGRGGYQDGTPGGWAFAGDDGGKGGLGGQAANGQKYIVNVGTATPELVVVTGNIKLESGAGGNAGHGGAGGNNGAAWSAAGGAGGAGGQGGQGGKGGTLNFNLVSKESILRDDIFLKAGNGGTGGNTGASGAGTGAGGAGGKGGDGGDLSFISETIVLDKDALAFDMASGDAGANGTSGTGGKGGDATVKVKGDLRVLGDNNVFTFTKGAAATDSSGKFNFEVDGALDIAEGKTLQMVISGDAMTAATNDSIHFDTLELQKDSRFETAAVVGHAMGNGAPGAVNYMVDNLAVHTNAQWDTNGNYAPNTGINGQGGRRVMFDMTDINPNHLMLEMTGAGAINVADLDASLQHQGYLNQLSNTSAFITSAYQLKRLNLGDVILADKTTGGAPGVNYLDADGHFVNQEDAHYFGFNAGLRRYYWDASIDFTDPDQAMHAENFYTADGYRVYLQGALASVTALNQTFFTNTDPLIRTAAASEAGKTVLNSNISASSVKTKTGSHVDVDHFSAGLALSHKFENDLGGTTIGAFLEYGYGEYDTYSNIMGFGALPNLKGALRGEGDTKHFGGGLFARHDFEQGTYVEASARGGSVENDFKVKYDARFNNSNPYNHGYNTTSAYYGAHLGLGHKFELTDQTELDVYGKALWTRAKADSFTTDFGEHVKTDDIDSVRSRLGARLNHANSDGTVKGFVGAAWEHEYDGKTDGYVGNSTIGYDRITDLPDIKGSSLFAEAGLSFKPEDGFYTFDISVFGLAGKQEGFGGTVGLKWEF